MEYFLTMIYNSLICSLVVLLYLLIRAIFKSKVSHNVLYYNAILVMILFAIPIGMFTTKQNTTHIKLSYASDNLTISEGLSGMVITSNEDFDITFLTFAYLIWISVVFILICYTFLRYITMLKKISRWCSNYEIRNSNFTIGNIFRCSIISTPVLIGVIKTTLLLPDNIQDNELQLILKHEATHKRRKDVLTKIIVTIIAILHWFNPCVWLLLKFINTECELSCDELCIKDLSKDKRVQYAQLLLRLAESQQHIRFSFVLSFSNNAGLLKERLGLIMTKRKIKPIVISMFSIGAAVILISGSFLVSAFSVIKSSSPEDIIRNYVTNPTEYQNLAVKDFLNPKFINNTKLIEITKADTKYAYVHHVKFSGKYTDIVGYNVKYEVEYKDDYEYMMTEPSGIKEKLFILVDTETGWLIDSVGY